jgi:hypothetical protein
VTEPAPDWATSVPVIPDVHVEPPRSAQWEAMSQQQLAALRARLIESLVQVVVQAVKGVFIPGGGVGGALDQFTSIFDNLLGEDFLTGDWASLLSGLLSGDQPINVQTLFGAIPPELLSLIPINIIGTPQSQPMVASTFPDAASVSGAGLWQWDSSVTHSVDGTGSMKVVADGTMKAARGAPIPVNDGQRITPSMFAKWTGYVGAGATVQLQVIRFSGTVAAPVEVGTSTVASITPTAGAGGWTEVTGNYAIPTGQNITHVRTRIVVTSGATAGTLYFDDGTYELSSNFVENLTSWFQLPLIGDLFGDPDTFDPSDLIPVPVLDMGNIIHEALTGVLPGGDLLEDILAALQNIPYLNVGGVAGPSNIGSSILETLNNIVGGFVGAVGSGASLADVFNIANVISSNATLGSFSWDLLGIRNKYSLASGMLPTSSSGTVSLEQVGAGASATTFTVSSSTATVLWKRFEESMSLGVISWLGHGTTNITDMRVNIWKMDPVTGDVELAHASANIIGDVSGAGSPEYNTYELPTPIAVEVTEIYGAEIEVRASTGGGTHNVAGKQYWLPSHPTVFPRRFQSVRNSGATTPPSTISSGSVNYATTNVPFIEFAVETGPGTEFHEPQRVPFTSSSTTTIPSWANYIDVIAVGGGGGGRQGGTWGVAGEGGDAGQWNTDTWVRDVDFDDTDTTITITINNGGTGGSGSGSAGGTAVAAVTSAGLTLTANGGAGGTSLNAGGSTSPGDSPGNQIYQGWTYVGGATQNSYSAAGNAPGGGGAGGNWATFSAGGNGAKGAVWIVARQT